MDSLVAQTTLTIVMATVIGTVLSSRCLLATWCEATSANSLSSLVKG